MIIYPTPYFLDQINKFNIENSYNKLIERIKKSNCIQPPFERFKKYLKARINNYRVIGKTIIIDDMNILLLFEVFIRKDKEYEQFTGNPDEYIKNHIRCQYNEKELKVWLVNEKKSHTQITDCQYLPDEYQRWLQPLGWSYNIDNIVIYESEDWVSAIKVSQISDYWQTYNKMIEDIIGQCEKSSSNDLNNNRYQAERKDNCTIIYSILPVTDNEKIIFLHKPIFSLDPIEIGREINYKIAHFLDEYKDVLFDKNMLLPFARRAYPAEMVMDPEIWKNIEKEDEANLALSPEEEILLKDILTGEGLPVFINGRAGCGKSTMLMYIFAAYCYENISNFNNQHKLLYLTWNEGLLQRAKNNLRAILSCHHKFYDAKDLLTNKNIEEIINGSLFRFQDFLLSKLDLSTKKNFKEEKYVNFAKFKELYDQSFVDSSLSPELCWHIIRVYLKGYYIHYNRDIVGDEFTIEDYHSIPKSDKTVSDEIFKAVYDKVWSWYKNKLRENNLWDDQDLVLTLIQNDSYKGDYIAIFCDEAQDLTRLELQFVLYQSILHSFNLDHINRVSNLPFTFAGDPLQTINPTGFRWESLAGAFHFEILSTLVPEDRSNVKFKLKELTHNYRSSEPIIHLSNLIQLTRKALFSIEDIAPQLSWFRTETAQPLKFIINKNINLNEMIDNLQDTIMIVPCDEGCEDKFIDNDEELKAIFNTTRNGWTKSKILSPSAAKGLEFKKVVLYKFGDSLEVSVSTLLNQRNSNPTEFHSGTKIDYEYYFNKLYVAASRSMFNLLIIDSKKGDDNLWNSLITNINNFEMLIKEPLQWKEKILHSIPSGSKENFNELRETDPLSIAQAFENKGIKEFHPDSLKRAYDYYKSCGKNENATFCIASAYVLEGKYKEAGRKYEEIKDYVNAADAYWKGHLWNEFLGAFGILSVNSPQINNTNTPELEIARFMSDHFAITTIINFTQFLSDNYITYNINKSQWIEALYTYNDSIKNVEWNKLKDKEKSQISTVLIKYAELGFDFLFESAALCCYQTKDFQKAVDYWEKSNIQKYNEKNEYKIAKAFTIGFPQGCEWLSKAKAEDILFEQWKAQRIENLSKKDIEKWALYILPILERKNEYLDAFIIYMNIPNTKLDTFVKLINSMQTSVGISDIYNYLFDLIEYYIKEENATDAVKIATLTNMNLKITTEEKLILQCHLLSTIAHTKLPIPNIEKAKKELLDITHFIRSNINWTDFISVEELGSAYEKIGHYIDALKYYELYTEDETYRTFARERWIETKRKQIKLESHSKLKKSNYERELSNAYHDWNIPANIKYSESLNMPPKKIRQKNESEKAMYPMRHQFGRYEIIIQPGKKILLIDDELNTIQVNFNTLKIDGAFTMQKRETDLIHFFFKNDVDKINNENVFIVDRQSRKLIVKIKDASKEFSI